jgi:hypothetical protein
MPANIDAEVSAAIQLTLDVWKNPDNTFLSAGQRAALSN